MCCVSHCHPLSLAQVELADLVLCVANFAKWVNTANKLRITVIEGDTARLQHWKQRQSGTSFFPTNAFAIAATGVAPPSCLSLPGCHRRAGSLKTTQNCQRQLLLSLRCTDLTIKKCHSSVFLPWQLHTVIRTHSQIPATVSRGQTGRW